MSAPPYMKLYIADYHGDTTHLLTAAEHGAYLLLLMAMWRAGGKLPTDDAKLARLAKCSADEWAALRDTVLAFFRRRGSILTHKRVSREIAKYEDTSGKRSEAGKLGGSKTPNKTNAKAQANASGLLSKKQAIAHITRTRTIDSSEDKSSGGETAVLDFDKQAWTEGVVLLGGTKQARSLFGKLLADNGLEPKEMLPLIAAAKINHTQDAAAYLTKAAQMSGKRRNERGPAKRVGFV